MTKVEGTWNVNTIFGQLVNLALMLLTYVNWFSFLSDVEMLTEKEAFLKFYSPSRWLTGG